MNDLPKDTRYAKHDQWVRADRGNIVQIGLTERAAAIADVVHVTLPTVGATVVAGDLLGEIENTEGLHQLVSPVSGVIIDVNQSIAENPESLTQETAEQTWLFEVELNDEAELANLMDETHYGEYREEN